jgi:dipeptidyl aminopeptidase/acylaminoacyl peptidase
MRIHLLPFLMICLLSVDVCFGQDKKTKSGIEPFPSKVVVTDQNVPPIEQSVTDMVSPYFNVTKTELAAWLKQGIVISTDLSGSAQLHLIEKKQGARTQLSYHNGDLSIAGSLALSSTDQVLFYQENPVAQVSHVAAFQLQNGKTIPVSDQSFDGWFVVASDDESQVAWCTAFQDMDYDVYRAPVGDLDHSRLVFDAAGITMPLCFSPDNKYLLVCQLHSYSNCDLFLVDLTDGTSKQVFEQEENYFVDNNADFHKDGLRAFLLTTFDNDDKYLASYDLKTNQMTNLAPELGPVSNFQYHPGKDRFVIVSKKDGRPQLDFKLRKDGKYVYRAVYVPEDATIGRVAFSPDGEQLAFEMTRPNHPKDVFVADVPTLLTNRWTTSEIGGLNPDDFATPTMIQYPTFDQVDGEQRMIEAVYYTPDPKKFGEGPYPVYVHIHGGPVGQARREFDPEIQLLISELGVAIVQPNIRGSSGYGAEFEQADNGDLRLDAIKDVNACFDWIGQQSELDENRVALSGTSYGGWVVNYFMTQYSSAACGISVSGTSSFAELYGDEKSAGLHEEFGDYSDPKTAKFLDHISPLNHSRNVTRPMLLIHGTIDENVRIVHSRDFADALAEIKVPVWLEELEGVGHRISDRKDLVRKNEVLITFLYEFLIDVK